MKKVTYFGLQEFLKSGIAKKNGIDNTPTFDVVEHLKELCIVILDPLREAWGSPILINSGYRCDSLNKILKGSSETSVHKLGYAADIRPKNGKFDSFATFTKNWLIENNIPFDQFIVETDGVSKWLHIGLYNNEKKQRRQFKSILN